MKQILIIISTWNRRDLTGLTLDSVKRHKSTESDVLILDDCSTEYDQAWLEQWGFPVETVVNRLGVGKAARRRFAQFLETDYGYLCTLDNDCLVSSWFDLYLRNMFNTLNDGALTLTSGYRSVTQQVTDTYRYYAKVSTINGINQFVNRTTAEKVIEAMQSKWEHTWDGELSKVASQIFVPEKSLIQHTGIYGSGVNGPSKDVAVGFVGDEPR